MSQEFDTNDRVLCFDQNYFYEAKCIFTRIKDSERQYFIYYTGRNEYEWVPEGRLRKFDYETLMNVKEWLCPDLKLNLEKQSNKEYYLSCDSNTPIILYGEYNKGYDRCISDKHAANLTAQNILEEVFDFVDTKKTDEHKDVRFLLEDSLEKSTDRAIHSSAFMIDDEIDRNESFNTDKTDEFSFQLENSSEKSISDTSDDSSTENEDYKTESVLCFDGRLFYEAICVNRVKTSEGMNYFVHYVGWDNSWDEWVNESRILDMTEENLKRHIHLIDFAVLSDSFKSRFPDIIKKRDTSEDPVLIPYRFSVGEKLLCFDRKLFFEGICRNTVVIDQKPKYLIHYCSFGKALDEWVDENRLLKRTEKNIESHRSLIARVMDSGCDLKKSEFKLSNLKLI